MCGKGKDYSSNVSPLPAVQSGHRFPKGAGSLRESLDRKALDGLLASSSSLHWGLEKTLSAEGRWRTLSIEWSSFEGDRGSVPASLGLRTIYQCVCNGFEEQTVHRKQRRVVSTKRASIRERGTCPYFVLVWEEGRKVEPSCLHRESVHWLAEM